MIRLQSGALWLAFIAAPGLIPPQPAVAQSANAGMAAPVTSVAAPADSKAALGMAVATRLFPAGIYRQIMGGTVQQIMDASMASMYDLKPGDIDPSADNPGGKTMGQLAEEKDPYFRERMKISMNTMFGEMIPMMEKFEPTIRQAIATAYTSRYTEAELTELDRFFTTPAGSHYAADSMLIYTDPAVLRSMQAFTPELMKAMPAIMEKVAKATAHLPLPKGGKAR